MLALSWGNKGHWGGEAAAHCAARVNCPVRGVSIVGIINIDDLQPGMVLAADLRSSQGRMLLPKGSALTEKGLRTCKIWGVTEADVVGVREEQIEASHLNELDPDVLTACKALARRRFMLSDMRHEAVRELAKLSVVRMARRMTPDHARDVLASLREDSPAETEPAAACVAGESIPKLPRLDIDHIIGRDPDLSSLPDVFAQIVEALKSPRSSAAYVAEVVSKDPSLSARLLRLVNSPFYGFPQKVETLSRAVAVIGSKQLTNLAMGISVLSLFKDIPPDVVNMKAFWQHSVACGIMARLLAGQIGNQSEERFFVAGLLHDLGRLVMLKNYPDHARCAMQLAHDRGMALFRTEALCWGFDHAELTSALLTKWKFPVILEKTILYHHQPGKARAMLDAALLHTADAAAHGLGVGASGMPFVPSLDPGAWATLGLPKNVLRSVAKQLDHQVEEIMHAFFNDHE